MLYFTTAAAAAAAGFRPCLRCRPEAAPGTPAWLGTSAVVRRALRLIHDGILDEGTVEELAARLGVGARHLHRLFVRHVGAPPIAVAQTRRLQFAKRLIDETSLSMTEIALAAGFGSVRRFNDAFRATYGKAPRELRRRWRSGGAAFGSDEVALRLSYRPPYDWAQVREFLESRAIPGVERIDHRGYARTVATENGSAVICVRRIGDEDALELRVCGAAPTSLFQISSVARRVFDVSADPALISLALGTDPLLAPLVRRRPGLRIPGDWDLFESAARAIIAYGVSATTARMLATRFVLRCGRVLSEGPERLTHLFPSPAAVEQGDLEGLGLARRRVSALRSLACAINERLIDVSAPIDEVTNALASIAGIGASLAQHVALRALGEPDALPLRDPVLRRRAGGNGYLLSPHALVARGERWRPWRSYAVMHLWCS